MNIDRVTLFLPITKQTNECLRERESLTKIEHVSRACERFCVRDLTELSMVTGLVKSEARNRGLRLGLTSAWRAARKERDVKNEGFIIMSVIVYLY